MAIGYFLRSLGLLKRSDSKVLSTLMMNVTLPSMIIYNMNGARITLDVFGATLIGFTVNGIYLLFAILLSDRSDKDDYIVKVTSICSYNIGSYTIPVLSGFLSQSAMTSVLTFNYPGTAIYTYGIIPAFGNAIYSKREKSYITTFLNSVKKSLPTLACFAMIILCAFGISLPESVMGFFSTVNQANTVIAMLFIGIMLDFKCPKDEIFDDIKIIAVRLGLSIFFALVIYKFISLDIEVKKAIVLAVFSPIGSSMPATAQHSGYEGTRVATINSIYTIISVISMSVVIYILY